MYFFFQNLFNLKELVGRKGVGKGKHRKNSTRKKIITHDGRNQLLTIITINVNGLNAAM